MPRSAFWLTVVLVLAGCFGLRESRRADGALVAVDVRFLDWLTANVGRPRGEAASPPGFGVTLVEIGDDALADRANGAGERSAAASPAVDPPLSPLDYALFLQAAETLGAAVVAVEPVLAWPRERQQGEYERILLNQALLAPKLLLGVRAAAAVQEPRRRRPVAAVTTVEPVAGQPEEVESRPLSPLVTPGGGLPTASPATIVPPLRHVRGDVSALPELPNLARRPAERLLLVGTPGPTDLPAATICPEQDGVVRAVPLLFRGPQDEVLPSFCLQAAMLLFRLTPDEVHVNLDAREIALGTVTSVPVDAAGTMRVDFAGFRRLSRFGLDDYLLAAGGEDDRRRRPRPDEIPLPPSGGLALLGRGDARARTLRFPTGEDGAPAELFTVALATLGRRTFVIRAPLAYDVLVVVAVAALGWLCLALRRGAALTLTGATGLVYTLFTLGVFEANRLWLPWALPMALLALLALLVTGLVPREER